MVEGLQFNIFNLLMNHAYRKTSQRKVSGSSESIKVMDEERKRTWQLLQKKWGTKFRESINMQTNWEKQVSFGSGYRKKTMLVIKSTSQCVRFVKRRMDCMPSSKGGQKREMIRLLGSQWGFCWMSVVCYSNWTVRLIPMKWGIFWLGLHVYCGTTKSQVVLLKIRENTRITYSRILIFL